MAKAKRRVNESRSSATDAFAEPARRPTSPNESVPNWAVWCRSLAVAGFGGLLAFVAFDPADSVEIERGEGLWFSTFAIAVWTLTLVSEPWQASRRSAESSDRSGFIDRCFGDVTIDTAAWLLAIWMMMAALAMCPPGNLRSATNEAWFWVAAAATLTAARRLLVERSCRMMAFALLIAMTFAMALDACYELAVELPRMRAEYLADPDEMLRQAGIDAPRQSAARMVFANRLLDGGPTSTYLLANSLAAVLSLPILAGVLAVIHWRRKRASLGTAGLGLIAISVGGLALVGTQSRSGLLACILAAVYLTFRMNGSDDAIAADTTEDSAPTSLGPSRPAWWQRSLVPSIVGVIAVAFGFVSVGLLSDAEWIDAAPSSLLFRLQYWKSTLAMLADHPWFGAGPGTFQAMYLQYRLPQANETIADPHNFVFETLAAGGIVAGALLLTLAILLVRAYRRSQPDTTRRQPALPDSSSTPFADHQLAMKMAIGAVVSSGVICLLSIAAGNLPKLGQILLVMPGAIAAGTLAWKSRSRLTALIPWAGAVLIAMLLHLCVSGGWTVPGVAVVIWIAVAILVPHESGALGNTGASRHGRSRRNASLWMLSLGLILLLTIRTTSLVPVTSAGTAMSRAEYAAQSGLAAKAIIDIESAVAHDPWGTAPAIWHSDLLKTKLINEGDTVRHRSEWESAADEVLRRCGIDPIARRSVAEQYLHVYQCFGKAADLERADQMLMDLCRDNPTDVSLVAQAALVAHQQGRGAEAKRLAQQARGLSTLGENVVRLLGLQFAYVVRPIGPAAVNAPVQERIKVQFSRIPGWPSEP